MRVICQHCKQEKSHLFFGLIEVWSWRPDDGTPVSHSICPACLKERYPPTPANRLARLALVVMFCGLVLLSGQPATCYPGERHCAYFVPCKTDEDCKTSRDCQLSCYDWNDTRRCL